MAVPLPHLFLKGVHLFRQGDFWEAHEAWEDLWRVSQDPERTLLKALIQIAAACIHARRGHWRGVQGLLTRVDRYLSQVPEGTLNLQITPLRAQVQEALAFARKAEHKAASPRSLTISLPLSADS